MTARSLLRPLVPLVASLLAAALNAQRPEPIDDAANQILRRAGLEQSQVMDHLSWICDVHGPRLTGSPGIKRAQAWAAETFRSWGLANVHLEEWGPFGRGWQLDSFSMHVTGENPWPVLAWPKAWSPSIDGEIVAEVVNADALTAEQLKEIDLSDKIVLTESIRELTEWFDGTATRLDAEDLLSMATGAPRAPRDASGGTPASGDFRAGFQRRQAMNNVLRENPPLMMLDRSYKGDYGTLFVQGATVIHGEGRPRPQDLGAMVIPQATLSVEHYNRICRLLEKGIPVKLAVTLKARYFDADTMEHNVIAEIPGTDPQIGDEVVMLGAHFDSWHSGTGATDNGCGSAVMMEAMRLLHVLTQETGKGPRRTIRVGLWSGEEQGLLGSRAYVSQHYAESAGRGVPPREFKPEHAKFAGYFNLDNGTGRIRGVYLQQNEAVGPIFRAWLAPFFDLDATTITSQNTGGTDHQSFDAVGLPGFQFIQDPVAYNTRTHHSNMDVWDHAVADDLKQAATIIASFAWHAAQRDEKLPRKPLLDAEPTEASGQGRRRGR